jgi:ribulose-phosphate 3-epimerase
MQTIIPAIIPQSFEQLEHTLESISAFTHYVQVDIVDGKFVPFTSWPYGDGDTISDITSLAQKFVLEFDLMVRDPEVVLDEYIKAGAGSVVIHLESTEEIERVFEHHDAHKYQLGLSILNDTPLGELIKLAHRANFVQLMGIADIGSQGQSFDERVLPRIRELRAEFPALLISIDGSVSKETLPRLKEAGANRFVSGSAILKDDDPGEMFGALEKLAT